MALQKIRIDFVSDIACPWCVIGLRGLLLALHSLRQELIAELAFVPFELNPEMGAQGENAFEHVRAKYQATEEDSAALRQAIIDNGKTLGFTFNYSPQTRIWNTFDAHRLLWWAGREGKALETKQALFKANFTDGKNVSDLDVLSGVAREVGLDPRRAREMLLSSEFEKEVREEEVAWLNDGIGAVPVVAINRRWLIQGAQPAAAYAQALRDVASGKAKIEEAS
ncbi:MAG: DsbA family oxidoreductase [Hyphomonadaceae bacterium]|nr:DsbA family oxidoreductase [Hyphomonadaceae bacterium]MBX3510991.1 DsbA family oxidoreductase [Hyphomonadaceae bacterium]